MIKFLYSVFSKKKYFASQKYRFYIYNGKFPDWLIFEL